MDSIDQIKNDRRSYASKQKRKINPKPKLPIIFTEYPNFQPLVNYKPKTDGYVYFIFSKEYEKVGKYFVKIGMTVDLTSRLSSLQTGNPYLLEFYKTIQTPDYKILEKRLHKKFESKRIINEWFNITFQEIDQVIVDWCLV